jgi:diguanylate cyclase (GGDEF)-like protein/PAS domain S-box-containing protein
MYINWEKDELPPIYCTRYKMRDENKTKAQLINELGASRQMISELKKLERYQFEHRYRNLIDSIADIIYTLSTDGTITSLNPAFEKITGLSVDECVGRKFDQLIHPEDLPLSLEKFQCALRGELPPKFELRSLSKSGEYLFGEFTAIPVMLDERVDSVVGIVRDITERKKMEEQLRYLSFFDDLTGLYNRRAFFTFAEEFLNLAKRQKQGLFMLYIDLDNLKLINDTFGHREGDQALIDSANVIKETYRESDIVARIAGDEFVVIPIGTTGDNIEKITGRLLKNIEEHNLTKKRNFMLSMSFGISYYDPAAPRSINELIAHADKMMYEQKKRKKKS